MCDEAQYGIAWYYHTQSTLAFSSSKPSDVHILKKGPYEQVLIKRYAMVRHIR